ncbi:hypothetical protein PPYR_13813 [Photinus pyralis]|uniref:Major facilitator superfamily (MFS) profile domain-containing protein n=2 Tax=Photinus pyralis TaxID=7054 RepID=A0A5N4AA45_PHOPY|nr:hypothetical protein PPYR_13813 [Photinus pyralis]
MLAGVPYLVLWMMSFVFSSLTDCAITLKHLKVGLARKTATTIGFAIPAAALFGLGLINSFEFDDWELTVVLLVIAIGINASAYCGYHVNHMDLSPNHAGTLMGIANSASNFFAVFAPLLQQFIVTDHRNPHQWAIVFYTSSGVYIVGNLVYVLFGSGEAQTWDELSSCKVI